MLLNCHTYYSFCYGTLSPEELMDEVQRKGYDSFVLSDINNTSAILDALRLSAERKSLKVIPGIDFRNGVQQQFIGIAINNEGFKKLNEFLSSHLHSATTVEATAPVIEDAYFIYPFSKYAGKPLLENEF